MPERTARIERKTAETDVSVSLRLDGELSFDAVTATLIRELGLLEPYGCGNPEPVFASPPVAVQSRRTFGENHVALVLRDAAAGVTLKAKAWRLAAVIGQETAGTRRPARRSRRAPVRGFPGACPASWLPSWLPSPSWSSCFT